MNLIKTINDFLVVYNEHERLCEELEDKPVAYYADYKVQKIRLPSGAYNLMVNKFDPGARDFHKFCDISLFHTEGATINIIDKQSDIILQYYRAHEIRYISSMNNYSGFIDCNLTKDELFNIRMQYEISYSYDEIMAFFDLTKNITKPSWIREQ